MLEDGENLPERVRHGIHFPSVLHLGLEKGCRACIYSEILKEDKKARAVEINVFSATAPTKDEAQMTGESDGGQGFSQRSNLGFSSRN
jgi:hypothetical protein